MVTTRPNSPLDFGTTSRRGSGGGSRGRRDLAEHRAAGLGPTGCGEAWFGDGNPLNRLVLVRTNSDEHSPPD